MMIHKIIVGSLETNCYIVSDEESKKALIIDPGEEAEKIIDFILQKRLKPIGVILTHLHFDHVGALEEVQKNFSIKLIKPQQTKEIKTGEIVLEIIPTPGHSRGSVCIVAGEDIFTGDTLFKDTVGRTDLEGGNSDQLMQSLKILMEYPDYYKIHPGHGPDSTIGQERKNNPFLVH